MSTELGWAYEVLGVKPGVSDRELKAAHRDLAKVWHPDRFVHDPRLQEKAQEKLKEINEAYEQLVSRHTRRVPPPPRRAATQAASDVSVPVRRGVGWHWWVAAPLAMFALVFAVSTRTLLRDPAPPVESTQSVESMSDEPATSEERSNVARNRTENNQAPADSEVISEPVPATETVTPVATVTVLVDPANGLLATPTCPVKSRMTYPSGSEPRTHCNVTHIIKPEKENGIKGLAKRIL